jgi:hypothetical protein
MNDAHSDEPITRLTFDAAKLMAEHPPRLRNRNKQLVFDIACPRGCSVGGTIVYSRWWAMPLSASLQGVIATTVEGREDVYDYAPVEIDGKALEWHVNFADPHLFVAYASGLFAQDEMQVAEHPVLGALLEALTATDERTLTVQANVPTPVLVRGAERRVRIAVDADASAGRPQGLYGNRFAAASPEAVTRATHRIDPATITNLIAMAAPQGGSGRYGADEIEHILTTAYTAFRAARIESRQATGSATPRTIVHTGFWGCGAFGGHRVLMAILQILAARLAGIDRVVFHTFDAAGMRALRDAVTTLDRLLADKANDTRNLVRRIESLSFQWGVSDGN